jgi:hypothetical protein
MADPKLIALRLGALLLAFSMATMPVCAARCAAQTCSGPLSGDTAGDCHHSSGDADSPGIKSQMMSVFCAGGEAVFTLLRPEQHFRAKNSASRPAALPLPIAVFDASDGFITTAGLSNGMASPRQIPTASVSQAPLRL